MVWRSRVIFTRSSRAASAGEGARTWTAAAGWLTGVGADAAFSIAASMSPLVTRPSLPEPGTVAASNPLSAESLRTDGASGASAGGTLWVVLADAAADAAAAAGSGDGGAPAFAGTAAGLAAAPAAPSLICPSKAPTATVSPSLAMISPSVPAEGAGTSIVTLSVSSSTKGSSTATASPAFLNQRPMVASVTDSPSVGTRISVIGWFPRYPVWSSSVKANDPVIRDDHDRGRPRGLLDAPLSRGMTDCNFLNSTPRRAAP